MQMPSEDTKLQLLHEHYQDTFSVHEHAITVRERYFYLSLGLIGILLFQAAFPQAATNAFAQFMAKHFDVQEQINVSFLSSLLWFVLLATTTRYFQTMVNIERQYGYIHQLEAQLSKHFDGKALTREGKSYLSKYPLFSDWTHFLYTWAFPLTLIGIVGLRVIVEFKRSGCPPSAGTCIDAVIGACIVISAILYLRMIHGKK